MVSRTKGENMSELPIFGAGIWHFATYKDRYATDGYGREVGLLEQIDRAGAVGELSVVDLNYPFVGFEGTLEDVKEALARNGLRAIAITPEIYTRDFMKGSFTNPDPAVRAKALELMHDATAVAKELGCDYVKLWTGQDGWDYPFQVDYHDIWNLALDGVKELVGAHPDINFVIEYKPREPRVKIIFPNVARTLLAIEKIGLPNLGILLDFGHSLYGLETPADAAQLAIDYNRLFAIDVNDNMRGWDDDMVVGSVHLVETFEFFHTLRKNGWQGVWQLDQFPFREDTVEAARLAIRFLKAIHRALDTIDDEALAVAQNNHDALAAQRLVQNALLSSMAAAEVSS
jgi:xylose isomerase